MITTSAPPLVFEFLHFTKAKFFSNKVLPINIPRPRPTFDFSMVSFDLKYGSPIFDKMSLGYPFPSSSIIISVISLSLLRLI